LLDDEQQGVIFQRGIGVAHPSFPEILHRLGNQAIGEMSLQTRTKVLNNELEGVFRRWYPLFRVKAQAA